MKKLMLACMLIGVMCLAVGCGNTKSNKVDDKTNIEDNTNLEEDMNLEDNTVNDATNGTITDSDNDGNLIENAGEAVDDVGNGVGNAVEDVGEGIGNAVKDVGDGVRDVTDDATNNTTDNNRVNDETTNP